MEEENRGKILLELALHRYDEEVERNEAIDNKNKSMVAFLAVMLTIQCSILLRLIELNEIITTNEMILLLLLFIISFVLNFLSLLYFISTLTYLDKLKSSPKIDDLVNFGIKKKSSEYLIKNTIISLNKSVKENKAILKEKSVKEKRGILLMRMGLIVTTMFIFFIVLIIIWGYVMSNEKNNNIEIDDDSGWFSEPSIEFVIEPDDDEKGIFERIKSFFRLLY